MEDDILQESKDWLANVEPKPKKFTLAYGVHRGTLVSRDISTETRDSLQECEDLLAKYEQNLPNGYMIWYARVETPDGQQIRIHPGNGYSSY